MFVESFSTQFNTMSHDVYKSSHQSFTYWWLRSWSIKKITLNHLNYPNLIFVIQKQKFNRFEFRVSLSKIREKAKNEKLLLSGTKDEVIRRIVSYGKSDAPNYNPLDVKTFPQNHLKIIAKELLVSTSVNGSKGLQFNLSTWRITKLKFKGITSSTVVNRVIHHDTFFFF